MTKPRGTVIIAGRFCFPEGDPASQRVLGMAQALRKAGYEPLVASAAMREREEDRQDDGTYRYRGIAYCALNEGATPASGMLGKLRNYVNLGSATTRWVRRQDLSHCRAFVSAGGYAQLHLRLFRYLQRRGVPYVVDCLDWFDVTHTAGLVRVLQAPNTELTMRLLNRQAGHIIAISKFFEDHYLERGCHVVRVPPLVDMSDPKWPPAGSRCSSDPPLRLVYAGTPGRKDQLAPVVLGLAIACQQGVNAVLELVGLSRTELAAHLGSHSRWLDNLGSRVVFHKRLPASAVPERLARADFSVLLRPVARYSQAGFPTKVVESLAAGVPVICNRTSNIAEYVRDGVEGILLDGNSPEDFVRGLIRAVSLGPVHWERMREAARIRARQCFDYGQYVEPLQQFLERASEPHHVSRTAA